MNREEYENKEEEKEVEGMDHLDEREVSSGYHIAQPESPKALVEVGESHQESSNNTHHYS